MDCNQILLLGLGIEAPWKLVEQRLDMDKQPHELHLEVKAERGAKYPCPVCGQACSAHDFQEKTWRHWNFFQHHCYIHASVPRVKCQEHGVKRVEVPWARKGSAFTLLFEQAALVREMSVNAAARIIEITDKRLWRIVEHYVGKAVSPFNLSDIEPVGLDEAASKRGRNYATVFIDTEKRQEPVVFATPGKGKQPLKQFSAFLDAHEGDPANIREAVFDMSPAFLSGVAEELPNPQVTVDRFHIVQTFTKALDEVRKQESRIKPLPKHLRWGVLKRGDADHLTPNQLKALAELLEQGLDTATAWRIKERLRWIRLAKTPQAAKWRITRFISYTRELIGESPFLEPVRKALVTLEKHAERVVRRWTSTYTHARMEGLNSLFQAARARARGYRNTGTFITMTYMIASPAASILKST
ncbi:ISL3 family transposase [Thiolapillus sp.]|uniref:ISL3 family transposase n=5 Tax=Thiolapillus sp. TaxID=2017437 RepID=UPI003AF7DB07